MKSHNFPGERKLDLDSEEIRLEWHRLMFEQDDFVYPGSEIPDPSSVLRKFPDVQSPEPASPTIAPFSPLTTDFNHDTIITTPPFFSSSEPKAGALTLLSIPVEILYEVFEYIPFYDLKTRIPLVCQKFREVQQRKDIYACGPLDRTLFRDAPVPRTRKAEEFSVHPAFAILDYVYADKDDAMMIRNSWANFEADIRHASVGKDNATSPAVKELVFHPFFRIDDGVHVTGTSSNGAVTVADVMSAVRHIVKNGKALNRYAGYWWTGIERLEVHEDDGLVHVWDDEHECRSLQCHHRINGDLSPRVDSKRMQFPEDWFKDILSETFMSHEALETEICDLITGTFMDDTDW